MSYSFDGNDDISSADNANAALAEPDFTWFVCVKVTAQPTGRGVVVNHKVTLTAGDYHRAIEIKEPGTSGFRFQFAELFGASYGVWEYQTDLSLNRWYSIGVVYNGGSALNDPTVYLDGSAVSVTETLTPSGSAETGEDTIVIGRFNSGSLQLTDAKVAQLAFYSDMKDASGMLALHNSLPTLVSTNRLYYLPLLTDAVDSDGFTGTMTVTGATLDTGDNPFDDVALAVDSGVYNLAGQASIFRIGSPLYLRYRK